MKGKAPAQACQHDASGVLRNAEPSRRDYTGYFCRGRGSRTSFTLKTYLFKINKEIKKQTNPPQSFSERSGQHPKRNFYSFLLLFLFQMKTQKRVPEKCEKINVHPNPNNLDNHEEKRFLSL